MNNENRVETVFLHFDEIHSSIVRPLPNHKDSYLFEDQTGCMDEWLRKNSGAIELCPDCHCFA